MYTNKYLMKVVIVLERIAYLRAGGRQPIRIGGSGYDPDVQGRIPAGWCEGCGTEVFDEEWRYCRRCKRRMDDEKLT